MIVSFVVKFKFYLKSGGVFECVEHLSEGKFVEIIKVVKTSMTEGIDASVCFEDCCVRLSDCSVIEWEILEDE